MVFSRRIFPTPLRFVTKLRGGVATLDGKPFWYDVFGDRNNPPVLLLMGAACQGIFWTPKFCRRLAASGFFVIRYDQRDTGFSWYPDRPYTLGDMARDAILLLDFLALPAAHLVGISMGGAVAQIAAVSFPSRVLSLTLIASTGNMGPVAAALRGRKGETFPLSSPEPEWFRFVGEVERIPSYRFLKRLNKHLEGWRILNGKKTPFPTGYYVRLLLLSLLRQRSYQALLRHRSALLSSVEELRRTEGKIGVPALIVHGGSDPLFPRDHGEHLQKTIGKSLYLPIEEMGHNFCPCFHERVISEIAKFCPDSGRKERDLTGPFRDW